MLMILLVLNSLFLIGLILNQNDSSKDSLKSQSFSASLLDNPLENITWLSLFVEFFCFCVKLKTTAI